MFGHPAIVPPPRRAVPCGVVTMSTAARGSGRPGPARPGNGPRPPARRRRDGAVGRPGRRPGNGHARTGPPGRGRRLGDHIHHVHVHVHATTTVPGTISAGEAQIAALEAQIAQQQATLGAATEAYDRTVVQLDATKAALAANLGLAPGPAAKLDAARNVLRGTSSSPTSAAPPRRRSRACSRRRAAPTRPAPSTSTSVSATWPPRSPRCSPDSAS